MNTKRKVWYREFDGWRYGQLGRGRSRRQKRLLQGLNTKACQRQAQKKYKQLLASDPGVLTELAPTDRLKSIFVAFLKSHSKRHCSAETHRWYRHFLRRFAKRFGTIRFCDLSPEHVEDWLDRARTKQKRPWSQTTRNRAITCVKVAVSCKDCSTVVPDSMPRVVPNWMPITTPR